MLQLLFQSIEQTLGPYLSGIARGVYLTGLGMLGISLVLPFYRRWMEVVARRLGLEQHWVMTCHACGKQTLVTSRRCGFCEEYLNIPGSVRAWSRATQRRPTGKGQRLRWVAHFIGSILFLFATMWVMGSAEVLRPSGEVHRLFLGLSLLALAAVGWFGGRAFAFNSSGMLARLRDTVGTLASVGGAILFVFLASQAKPASEILLAHFSTDMRSAIVGNRSVPLARGEIAFEYLQLDHDLVGFHHVIPLAFLGHERVPVSRCPLKAPLIHHLQDHQDAYAAQGLTVRIRTDRVRVSPGHSYEVVQRRGQVLIRRAKDVVLHGGVHEQSASESAGQRHTVLHVGLSPEEPQRSLFYSPT